MAKAATTAKRKYNNRVYLPFYTSMPKSLGEKFKAVCKREGISQRQIIIDAVTEFLKKYDEYPEDPEDE